LKFTEFNGEKIVTIYFHSDSGYWLILTYSGFVHKIKAGELDGLIKDGILK
jgi:hypothetical protein